MSIIKIARYLPPFCLVLLAACSVEKKASEAEEPEPEEGAFELEVTNPKIPIVQGANAELTVRLVRKGGFVGAVRVSAVPLPEGATLAPATIEAGSDEIRLELHAADDAPHSLPTEVELIGTADELESSVELTVTVCGHPGALDTSFQAGRAIVPVGAGDDYANALAVASDGKLVVAGSAAENLGDFALIRLERDGRLDESFGQHGKVLTSIGSGSDVARAVAIQSDGKLVVAGATTSSATGLDFAVVRYLSDGSLDESFGDGGRAVVSVGDDSDVAYAVLIQKDGKIVAAGSSNQGSSATGVDFALVRLNEDGSLDESFGDGGSVVTPIGSNAAGDAVYALASQELDGEEHIVAVGGEGDFALARYTPSGELDARFGTDGTVKSVFDSAIGAARAVLVTPDGELLVAGHHSHNFALARFDGSGELDASFGDEGSVSTPVSPDNWNEAQGLALEPGGNIVLGGWTYEGSSSSGNFALVRYSANGDLDARFGDDGIVITEVAAATKNDLANAILLQSDDRVPTVRVLLAGSANASNHDFAVTRYWR